MPFPKNKSPMNYDGLLNVPAVLQARFSKTNRNEEEKSSSSRALKQDVRTLKTIAKAKAGVALKRSPGATSVMAAKHGVSLSTRE